MGGEQAKAVPPPTGNGRSSSSKKQQPRGSQFAPTMGARGKSVVNISAEVNTAQNKKFAGEMLAAHNDYRARHKTPLLKLNNKLCHLAQEWADRISKLGTPDRRPPNFQFGQNLYYSRWATDAESVCRSWYKEGNKYVYEKEPDPPPVTNINFTQMMWKNTSEMGVGIASSWSNVTYIVCNYKPRGNVKGDYKKNVLPPVPVKTDDDKKDDKKDAAETQRPTSSVNLNVFQKKTLQLINEFRETHSAKPLKMTSTLTELAQKHAELMASLRKVEPFKGKVSPPVGTSLYCSKWYTDAKDACQFWYSESKRYKFDEPSIVSLSTVNFVQMVWVSTKEVGIGRAESFGYVYITAFYRPVGNILGEFTKNVKPFRVASNMTSNSDTQGAAARKSKAVSVVLPAV